MGFLKPEHHMIQGAQLPFPEDKVIELLQDPERLMRLSSNFTKLRRDDVDPHLWHVTETLDHFLSTSTSFSARFEPTSTGVRTTVCAALGVTVEGTWSVSSSSCAPSVCTATEDVVVSAPFPLFALVRRQFVATHLQLLPKIEKELRRAREAETRVEHEVGGEDRAKM